jgi:hypothetical protein
MGDGRFMLFGAGGAFVLGIAVIAALKKLGGAAWGAVPQVAKDGIEASGQLAKLGANMVAHPLDTFGIAPGVDQYGVPTWEQSTPWETPAYNPDPAQQPVPSKPGSIDPVSNNEAGINWNQLGG